MVLFIILVNFLHSAVEKQLVFGYIVVKLTELTIKILHLLNHLLESFPLSETSEESLDFDNSLGH